MRRPWRTHPDQQLLIDPIDEPVQFGEPVAPGRRWSPTWQPLYLNHKPAGAPTSSICDGGSGSRPARR